MALAGGAYEPTLRFVDHTLGCLQLVVDVNVAARLGLLDVLEVPSRAALLAGFSGDGRGRRVLRPDAFLCLA